MASDDDDDEIPDGDTCAKLCEEFAEITGTDFACGHFFLQDCAWNLPVALGRFFDRPQDGVAVVRDSAGLHKTAKASAGINDANEIVRPLTKFSLLSWNIDGLDNGNLSTRTKAVIDTIKRASYDIALLQEVVTESFALLESALDREYTILSGASSALGGYFTCILLRKASVQCCKHWIVPFTNTNMDRNMLFAEAIVCARPTVFMTTHLESCKEHAKTRIEQLGHCFQTILNIDLHKSVVFGGDLNLRDSEVSAAGGLPSALEDVWVACGSSKNTQYTWDCLKNDNKSVGDGKFKPRCRFDRLYLRPAANGKESFKAASFRLVGTETIRTSLCFPSDHFGLACEFAVT